MQSQTKAPIEQAVWDVIIVGSGPAGSSAAITLARSGAKVLMLEKRKQGHRSLGESIPPVAIELVEHFLGSTEQSLKDAATQTAGNIACWGDSQAAINDFYFTPKGYGLCVDRKYFDSALCQVALNEGAQSITNSSFIRCHRDDEKQHWHITVDQTNSSSMILKARYILDCSGRRATVASALGIKRHQHDDLFAFAQRFVSSSEDQDAYTRIEASPDGWFYSNKLPLMHKTQNRKGEVIEQHERIVVFHTDKHSHAAKQAVTATGFLTLLQDSPKIASYLEEAGYQATGRIQGAPAGGERLSRFCGDGWLAVGDAAQSYDPLSSQGIYKALNSGSMAGQMVHYALAESAKDTFFMKRYAQEQSQLWEQYVQQRNDYYASEQRWPKHTFWSRRHPSYLDTTSNIGKGASL